MKTGSLIAMCLLLLVAAAHVLRLVLNVEVIVGGVSIPVWVSLGGIIIPGGVALLLWRERESVPR